MVAAALTQGRIAYLARVWDEAYALLSAADRTKPLEPDDLEQAARAAYLTGREEDCFGLLERAFNERMRRDDPERAALDGFWMIYALMNRGDWARASGWIGRSRRAIDDGKRDCVARGYLMIPQGLQALMSGDVEAAYAAFNEQREIGQRFADPDLITLGRYGEGQTLIAMGRPTDGIAVLDEVMVGVTGGEVSAIVAGLVYCGVIAACMQAFDTRRATEWTAALNHWCDSQPGLVPYRGQCLVHRAQIMQLRGAWSDALEEARQAAEQFAKAGQPAAGDAVYQQAEVHRLRGDFTEAERNYRLAGEFGREAQPGLALLRLAQGRIDTALAGLRRAIDEAPTPVSRPLLLCALVEISLAARDVPAARQAADELTAIASSLAAPMVQAMAARADGAVLLAEGESSRALRAARRAWLVWQDLDAPYDAACTRVIVGLACRQLGDEDAAQMELAAARSVFAELPAPLDLARIDSLSGRTPVKSKCGLTAREVEVLRMVATGKTNRVIAAELFLSEKTVARHISNIFTKLDLTSRSAATAYAYENDLV